MKAVHVEYKEKFDNQYKFDLENNLSIHDFHSIIQTFNQVAQRHPLSLSMAYSTLVLLLLWMMATVVFCFIWLNFHNSYILFGLPLFMILTLFSLVLFNKRRVIKFEDKIIETCTRLNATENIRGINYRLTKDGMDINRPASSCYAAHYTLTIELDDRFNALKSREFREWITWPKTAYCPYDYEPVNMFEDESKKIHYLV